MDGTGGTALDYWLQYNSSRIVAGDGLLHALVVKDKSQIYPEFIIHFSTNPILEEWRQVLQAKKALTTEVLKA